MQFFLYLCSRKQKLYRHEKTNYSCDDGSRIDGVLLQDGQSEGFLGERVRPELVERNGTRWSEVLSAVSSQQSAVSNP